MEYVVIFTRRDNITLSTKMGIKGLEAVCALAVEGVLAKDSQFGTANVYEKCSTCEAIDAETVFSISAPVVPPTVHHLMERFWGK